MKYFIGIILFSTISFMKLNAQTIKNYEADWKTVDTHIEKGLPASALETVKKIYAKAKADKQDAQLVKSLVYMNQLQNENREDNEQQSISQIEKEIAVSKEPVVSLLNSYLAGIYQQYYNANRYKFYNRTNTVNFKKEDIATWTADDFHKRIGELYLASIKNEKLLQQTKLEPYDALITKGNVRYLRPTLFDLLAHRALNYFRNNERDISKPAYKFEIDNEAAFAPAAEFVKAKFETKDSLSLQHKALLVYQELLRFHLNDTKPDALIDADLSRLDFVRENSVHPEKETLFTHALNAIIKKYANTQGAAAAKLRLAIWYQNQYSYDVIQNPDTTTSRYLVKAKQLADEILQSEKEGNVYASAWNLRNELLYPNLGFETEKVNVPGKPFRMMVNYKNIDKIFLRVVPATTALKNAVQDFRGENKYWNSLAAAKATKAWMQPLPKTDDLANHRVEIKVDALPAGEYFIIASVNEDFGRSNNVLAMRLTYITNISFVNNENDYFVLHRDEGNPLANAAVQVWSRSYNYQTSKYTKTKIANYTSDKNGYFKLAAANKTNRSNGYALEVDYKGEKFFMDDEAYNYYYNAYNEENANKSQTNVFLFTDRSLYRPGQTVYFKGIAINRRSDGKKAEILPDYKTTLILYDVNNQKRDSIKVSANEFGSFSGNFKLPEGLLNGQFRIATSDRKGNSGFRVEEYKRPKFYVDYEKMKGTYKLNETITVTGMAKAYAGNNITGANVKYRVVRQARFPYPWLFWRGWWPRAEPQEIAHGETTTDDDGKFAIHFKAIPDLKIDAKNEPVFDYKIYADVTDLNGEVRSGEETVSVSYKSLLLKVNIADRVSIDNIKSLDIKTENMAGSFEAATVSVTISKLKAEQRLLRTRYWAKPDQFVMSKEEYINNFPNDIYKDEDDPKTWPKETVVLEQSGATDSTGNFTLDKTVFEPGYYVVEITTKDKDGKAVKDVQYVELYKDGQQPVFPQYLWTQAPKPVEPGEKTTIGLGSSASDIFVVQATTRPQTQYNFFKLDRTTKTDVFSATEADRGGYGVSYMFVKNNRVFQSNNNIAVPWTNKDLKVEYNTFRDKTLPGAEEKWSVKISGYKGQKVAAEMLASMYDASLDQFYPHQWQKPSLWFNFYNRSNWNGNTNFITAGATVENSYKTEYKNYDKTYDWIFEEDFHNAAWGGPIGRGRLAGVVVTASGNRQAKTLANDMVLEATAPVAMDAGISMDQKQSTVAFKSVNEEAASGSVDAANPSQGAETQIRRNFNETAFFFPDLKTDKDGNISFSFTMPEALTRWKFQALSHTKDLAIGYSSKEIITQKELMVQPNAPRFLREGDKMEFSSKVVNLSAKEITGTATLQLFDAATNEPVDGWFKNAVPQQYFTIAAGQSQSVNFPIEVPYQNAKPLVWRIVAKATTPSSGEAAALSDGEENVLPVLTNRMLVTETLPLNMRGSGTKNFAFEKLINSGKSETLSTQSLTVEYTSNPAWYAVQALPYLMEYPYDCAEQTWNRYYANALASIIANSSPKIKAVFEKWKTLDTAALQSNLEKNQELKAVLLEETPWVLQAQNESQQKKNIALLFDLMRMNRELGSAYEKLRQMQSPNGGFVWFKGGPDDRFITQYIITGIGHLKNLNAVSGQQDANLNRLVQAAMPYLDRKIKEEYDNLIKYKTDLSKYTPSYYVVQYLYMRSFFKSLKVNADAAKAVSYFTERATKTWTAQNKYMQAMIALTTHRNNDAVTPKAILKSLKETAINNEELGMYYKNNLRSWWWYDRPIETQALIVEAFEEAGKDKTTADDLRTWLLKNKQTNSWESTKATAEACYALLLRGSDWLSATPDVTINLGGLKIESQLEKTEAGTGYLKKTIPGDKVKPSMGNIGVTISNTSSKAPSWGGVYWQYFEQLDKISYAATPLQLNKKLFIETNSDRGPVLNPIADGATIKTGDKIKVRVELRVDRDMEYVHMKDMRAAGFEPINVLSAYKWQGGLGYYETTKDASTNFFFSYLPKGTYVFEYSLFATVAGNFSNGITTIQCMYAPEFTSHSEGLRVTVK